MKLGLPGGLESKESACNAGDLGLIPGLGKSLGEGMATHASILAWRIICIEEPGRLLSMGWQRAGHDFNSVQFSRSVLSDSLQPHESQHARPPCPSPTPGVHPDSRPSSR